MLDELAVANLGVIADAHIEPASGLTVVTGETGTGKTLLLGALRLLVGAPARTELIGPHADETRVEGRFLVENEEVGVARRVGRGRSRAYLDGAMAAARAVEERLAGIVEIVGQHDHLMLTTSGELRRLVDRSVPDEVVDRYRDAWAQMREVEDRVREVGGDRRSLERELDLISYQAGEIAAAGFSPGDDATLERELSRLRNVEELREYLAASRDGFETADDAMGGAVAALRRARDLDVEFEGLVVAAEAGAGALADLIREARVQFESLEADPEALAELESRWAVLADLRRKYGATLQDVLAFGAAAEKRRDELAGLLDGAGELEAALRFARQEVNAAGEALREARSSAGDSVGAGAVEHLKELGFDTPTVRITVEPADPGPRGADRIGLEFASDRRLAAGPVAKVASGGELSRLVLSLRLAAGAGDAAVVAFDEIDSGVGGATALALGRKLAALARQRQVLCVTHLPQVAAFADLHVVVERADTSARVRVVDGEERIEELSRMLSGLPESDAGREHAEELRRLAARETG